MATKKAYQKITDLMPLVVITFIFMVVVLVGKTFLFAKIDSIKGDSNLQTHQIAFSDEESFWKGIQKAGNVTSDIHIQGGIVPHHLLASFIIADFFHRLSYQSPSTIILLGPNHQEKGNFKVLTSLYGWSTPLGTVKPNESVIKSLIARKLSQVDEQVLPQDQAVTSLLPFIGYYMPQTKIVPLLISHRLNQEESKTLAQAISNVLDKDTVIVASVDFSHYLSNIQAEKKDVTTLQVLKKHDYRNLFLLNSDYLDSPASVSTVLMLMESVGANGMQIYYHTNSSELVENNGGPTTSYFSIGYY